MQGRITWSGKSCLPDHVVLPDSTVSRKQGCLYAANSPDLHNLILISSVNPHIPRYIEQDAHLAELQQQRCAAARAIVTRPALVLADALLLQERMAVLPVPDGVDWF